MNKLDLEETTRRFHNVYEQVAKEYGYKTREDTKELDFNSPNGMTMLKTVEMITTPYLEEIERLNELVKGLREERDYLFNKTTTESNYEIERLNNIINESAEEILKELEENHHLSYGVALAIRQKLLDYKELKGSDDNVND